MSNFDDVFKGGIDKGKITFIGLSYSGKSKLFKRTAIEEKPLINCPISDVLKYVKDNKIIPFETKLEKIGDTYFPVTYFENGIRIVEYPNKIK